MLSIDDSELAAAAEGRGSRPGRQKILEPGPNLLNSGGQGL